ncbi:MAG: lytic murein transglycosylase [Magnetococcales bacterium]|nr:lytic murein transglycosylase [Magnetococcales bacterium]
MAAWGLLSPSLALADVVDLYPWMNTWVTQDGMDRRWLDQLLGSLRPTTSILRSMDRQAEALPYHVYRERLLTTNLILQAKYRYKKHASILRRIENELQVNGEVVIALWGIESSFGRNQGKHSVLNTLFTLATGLPRRQSFFQQELRQFLLLCREEGWDPRSINGSYAGAMGQVQMMPSSLRCFALDFDGDGKRDVFNQTTDSLGSIANYLRRHGWQFNGLFAEEVKDHPLLAEIASKSIDDALPWIWWQDNGVQLEDNVRPDPHQLAAMIALEGEERMDYVMGFNNFRVITSWNRSRRFAMVVHELAWRIKQGL